MVGRGAVMIGNGGGKSRSRKWVGEWQQMIKELPVVMKEEKQRLAAEVVKERKRIATKEFALL